MKLLELIRLFLEQVVMASKSLRTVYSTLIQGCANSTKKKPSTQIIYCDPPLAGVVGTLQMNWSGGSWT